MSRTCPDLLRKGVRNWVSSGCKRGTLNVTFGLFRYDAFFLKDSGYSGKKHSQKVIAFWIKKWITFDVIFGPLSGVISGSLLGSAREGVLEGSDTHDVSILGLDT